MAPVNMHARFAPPFRARRGGPVCLRAIVLCILMLVCLSLWACVPASDSAEASKGPNTLPDGPYGAAEQDLRFSKLAADMDELAHSLADVHTQMAEALEDPQNEQRAEQLETIGRRHAELLDSGQIALADGYKIAELLLEEGVLEQEAFSRLDAAMRLVGQSLLFERSYSASTPSFSSFAEALAAPDADAKSAFYEPLWASYAKLDAVEKPAYLQEACLHYETALEQSSTYLFWSKGSARSSELELRAMNEAISWADKSIGAAQQLMSRLLAGQYDYASRMLAGSVSPEDAIEVSYAVEPTISPNLYAKSRLLELFVCSPVEQDVFVEAQIEGFTQAYESKWHLLPGQNYLAVHPEMLSFAAEDLELARSAQLDFRLRSADDELIEVQSLHVDIMGLYEFNWRNEELGDDARMHIAAWLQPDSPAVLALCRQAAEIMGQWTDGDVEQIAGYQYGEDWHACLLQVAAIQKAVSDSGVLYVSGSYTPRADQHILTPNAVLEKQQALCIEDCLLIASCLLAADMHPMIVITPGHAQVAVETWEESGRYLLVETASLPYYGVDPYGGPYDAGTYAGLVPFGENPGGGFDWLGSEGDSQTWSSYLASVEDGSDSYNGVYVLDCTWQSLMQIYGLALP